MTFQSLSSVLLKAGPGSHRNQYSLLLRGVDSRQGLGRGIDSWGNSPVLLSLYNGFVLLACVCLHVCVFSLES